MAHHGPTRNLYILVFAVLMALALLTTAVAFVDLGRFGIVVAMTIAITKMVLVILYFMHVRWSSRLTWVFVGAGFVWFLLLAGLTFSDYVSRSWMPAPAKAPRTMQPSIPL
jgi:cytochrome c oxidase subunit 4